MLWAWGTHSSKEWFSGAQQMSLQVTETFLAPASWETILKTKPCILKVDNGAGLGEEEGGCFHKSSKASLLLALWQAGRFSRSGSQGKKVGPEVYLKKCQLDSWHCRFSVHGALQTIFLGCTFYAGGLPRSLKQSLFLLSKVEISNSDHLSSALTDEWQVFRTAMWEGI
jgi:hypothetical protein